MARRSFLAPNVKRVSDGTSMPSPVGGMNALDSLAEMQPNQAVDMVNFFPQQYGVRVRKGWAYHATGLPGAVETLITYSADDGTQKLFAIAGNALYNVTTAGAVGAPVLSGFTNNRWQHQMMNNVFGSFLSMVNGADLPQKYDGTTWSNQTLTPDVGEVLNIHDLIHVTLAHRRLWYVEKNSGNAWYLDTDAIEGTLFRFGVGEVFPQGGYLNQIITWSMDSGQGMRDQTVFISSLGDIAVFQGIDPDDALNFTLVGVYHCGAPVGRRCAIKYASDVLIICEDGVLPLTAILSQTKVLMAAALSNIIQMRLSNAVAQYRNLFGWQMLLDNRDQMVFVNVPVPDMPGQFVMNTVTNAWTYFEGYVAHCWERFLEGPYYGSDGYVGHAWFGDLDAYVDSTGAGNFIIARCLQAYSYFGSPVQQKHWTMCRPVFNAGDTPIVSVGMNTDYDVDDTTPPLEDVTVISNVPKWDAAIWDLDYWSALRQVYKRWYGLNDIGFSGAIYLKVQTHAETYWVNTDFIYEAGGVL